MPLPAPKRPVRRRSAAGRKATLTTEAVVAAAIEVLDEGGVAGLSMRRVAEHLGTGAASLYAHVSGKEEEMLRYYAGVHAFCAALPAERYPVLASIAPDMTGHDDVERFSFGLDVLIAGLEAVDARIRETGQGAGQGEP